MRTNFWIGFLLLLLVSCGKFGLSKPDSISYRFSFPTEIRPVALAIEPKEGYIYLANHNPSSADFTSKIQKFNVKGEVQETVVDFSTLNSGLYNRYSPIDLCIDHDELFVLVKPMSPYQDSWMTYPGFCVLHFDLNGDMIHEYDFAELEDFYDFSAMACCNGAIFVTSGQLVIKKIDMNSGQADDIHIPITNDMPYLLVSDMEVESEQQIYMTGQGLWGFDSLHNDVSACHITRLNAAENESSTFTSSSRTGVMAAMPNNPGLTIRDGRYIYLATFYGRSLEIYDMEHELILEEEIKPAGVEETLPIDVGVYKDDIFIVDYRNDHVHVYNH